MTTITTSFLGPTNHRGSRYKAVANNDGKAGFQLTVEADDRLGLEANHYHVARLLIEKLGWFHDETRGDTYGDWYGGGQHDGGYVFVCAVEYAKLERHAPAVLAVK